MNTVTLPPQFQSLQPYVAHWVVDTSQRRFELRSESDMPSLVEFYNAMIEQGPAILEYLDDYSLHDMPPEAETLMKLMLALAQVAMAVEIHKMPRVPNSPWPNGLKITKGAVPFG